MKKSTKKVFLSLLAATTILTSSGSALADKITVTMPRVIYESTDSQHISSGVVYEKIMKFTDAGWWNINVLRINLIDQYTELKGLFNPSGIPIRDKVSTMVNKSGAIAAINGDYFNYKPLPSSMGTLINNGELISSPIEMAWSLPTFYLTNSDKAGIDYLDRKMVATNINKGNQVLINTVNKVTTEFDTVTLLNKNWGAISIGKKFHQDLVEVLIVNNVVQERRVGGEAFNIPQTGDAYVLAVRNTALDHFSTGDEVHLELTTVPDVDGIKFAIGGGSIILKDGELSLTNINNKGNEPRSGIGINKEQTELILVTIDGRDASFKGVSQEMFGAILRELGAYNALNLDGGGSTTMAIKPADEDKASVVNKPSDGGERQVVNAVGVFSNAPTGQLSYLKLKTDDSKMFAETTRTITVKGYDEFHNPVVLDDSLVVFSTEGIEGNFKGNKFKATTLGQGKINATYNGLVGSLDINVLGPIMDVSTSTTNFNIDINSQQKLGNFFGLDKDGNKAKIYLEDIVFNIIGGIGSIKDGIFYSTATAEGGAISAMAGSGVENILVSVGSKGVLADDFEILGNYSFVGYPQNVTGNINKNIDARDGVSSISLNYDFTQGENTRAAYVKFNPNGATGLKISGYPKKLGLWVKGDGSGTWLRGSMKDAKGTEYLVDFTKNIDFTDWQYLTVNVPTQVSYPISFQAIYVAEIDSLKKPSGQILFDGLQAYYPSSIGNMVLPTPTFLKDNLASKQSIVQAQNGFSFIVASEPKGLNQLVGYDATSSLKSRISKNKIGFMLNGSTPEFNMGIKNYSLIDTTNGYSIGKHYDLIYFNLNSSKGGIRATDPSQWTKLMNDLLVKDETNFVLFLPTPIFGANGFTDTLEADLLHRKLVEAKNKGKNIFVVHGGSGTKSELIDGIRYIQLNTKQLTKADDVYDISVAEFVVNGKDISYGISSVFQKPGIGQPVKPVGDKIQITINGQKVIFNDNMGNPFISSTSRTMVPIRIISEKMGFEVSWDQEGKKATITNGSTTSVLTIGKSTALVNNKEIAIDTQDGITVDTKAQLIGDRTYVPFRFIAEALGSNVSYERVDGVNQVTITTK